jgi:hypothetical protein
MSGQIEFKSSVLVRYRTALEQLLFFNSCQQRVAAGIADAVEMFGTPEIVASEDRLEVVLSEVPDAQTVFALEKGTGRPVGAAIYIRPDLEHITVLHLSIAAEYASGGLRDDEQLLLRLLREVRRSTRQMKGVRRLELYYGKGRTPATRWRASAKALA